MLVKTLVPREEEDDEISDGVQCYVPGIVQVVPLRKATATKCYTILRFNGKKVSNLSYLCRITHSPRSFEVPTVANGASARVLQCSFVNYE